MLGIPVVEVAIALALLYLFFSQVVTSLFEIWATAQNKRGRYLRRYLNQALNSGSDKNWAELVYRHPSVDMLVQKTNRPPAYVPSSVFVKAIVDLVIDEARTHKFVDSSAATDAPATPTGEYIYQAVDPPGSPLARFEAGLARMKEGDFKALLRTLLLNARGCTTCAGAADDEKVFAEFIHGLAVWYDGYMERVSGWYKRSIRLGLFVVGLLVAVACNLDSLRVANHLWMHSADRQRIVAYAARQAADSGSLRRMLRSTGQDSLGLLKAHQHYIRRVDSLAGTLQQLGFPIGWSIGEEAPTLDTVYQAVPASPLDKNGWQRQKYWLRYIRTRVVKPAEPKTQPTAADVAKVSRQVQKALVSGYSGGAQLPKAPSAVAPQAAQLAVLEAPPAVAKPAPRPKASKTILSQSRQKWLADTLLALRPGLVLVPLQASDQPKLAKAYQDEFPASASLLKNEGRNLANLPSGLGWAALGWLLTAAALSVGAPFWFEILNRFINVRNLGVRPPSSLATPAKEPS